MDRYSNLNVHGKITQIAEQGLMDNDVVKIEGLAPLTSKQSTSTGVSSIYYKGQIAVVGGATYICSEITNDASGTPTSSTVWTYTWTPMSSPDNVVGPQSSVDGHIAAFDGTTGKAIKDSGMAIETDKTNVTTAAVASMPTTAAVAGAIGDAIAAIPDPMIFKGTIGDSATITWANLPAPVSSGSSKNTGWTYKVITAYTNTGSSDYRPTAAVGDTIISTGSAWELVPSGDEPSGTVTNIATGTGLTGGPITTSGTISLADTAVTAGSYGQTADASLSLGGSFKVPYITVNAQGRLTAASDKTVTLPPFAASSITLADM